MKATEIRNILGIYDDDMLNAACESERKDELADEIVKKILKFHGKEKFYKDVFNFSWVKEVLESFGFVYFFSDEENEEHRFINNVTKDEISIYPVTFYPNQGAMRFKNFLIY